MIQLNRIPFRIKIAFLLIAMLIMVFAKNRMNTSHVTELGNSFASVYEDRLMVESYIYQLSGLIYQKKIAAAGTNAPQEFEGLKQKLEQQNHAIRKLLAAYQKTKLTRDEALHFASLKKNLNTLSTLEDQLLQNPTLTLNPVNRQQMDQLLNTTSENLQALSGIQVAEGKLMHYHSKQLVAGSTLLTYFELSLLILLAIFIQALVFSSRGAQQLFNSHPSLN